MFYIIQALGLIETALASLSLFQKEKWKTMLFLCVSNIVLIAIYILCGSLVGGLLTVGALLRTIVFLIYSKKNKKPNIFVLLAFEIYYIVITATLWSSYVDLFILINLMMLTYTTWQDNVKILRIGYMLSFFLLVPYDILIGAYTTVLSETILFISALVSLVKNRNNKPNSVTSDKNIDNNEKDNADNELEEPENKK